MTTTSARTNATINYSTGAGLASIDVYFVTVTLNAWDGSDVDVFSVEDDTFLGTGWDVEEALFDAEVKLSQKARGVIPAEDGFTAWQRANGEHVTVEVEGREIVVEAR